jgi:NADH dehydrogenase FAD-containing subunit
MNKKIVVIGGGYAGTEVIIQLMRKGVRNIEIELISNKRYFENIVGGTEIISDKVKAEELTYDLEELSNHWDFELTIDNVENIDLIRKKVKIGCSDRCRI